jgi:PEP-CTERM motif
MRLIGMTGNVRAALAIIGGAIVGLCGFGATKVEAAPVTFEFTVTVTQIEDSFGDLFGAVIQPGDKFKAYFTYDTSAMDYEPGAPWLGYYEMTGGSASFGVQTPRGFVSDDFFVNVQNDLSGHDTLTVQGYAPVIGAPGFDEGYLDFNVIAPDTWLSSDAPPSNLIAAQMAGFDTWLSFQASKSDARYTLIGKLTYDGPGTEDPPPAVPEPASLMLLGSGLIGIARLRHRRARA